MGKQSSFRQKRHGPNRLRGLGRELHVLKRKKKPPIGGWGEAQNALRILKGPEPPLVPMKEPGNRKNREKNF